MYFANEKRYDKMQYNRLGKSGLKLPAVSLGLWHNFGSTGNYSNMKELCFTAFDNGITHFDLANNYGPAPGSAEENFGKIFANEMRAYRDEMIISTKAGYEMWPGPYGCRNGSRKYLLASLDQSLKRMGLEYVDVFYHHCLDPETPLEETMGALAQAVRSGKALYAGVSNYDGENLEKACSILEDLKCPFVINQNRYSIFDRTIEKNGLKSTAARLNKGIIAFSPLAQGLLTDRYLNGIPSDSRVMTDGRFLSVNAITEEKLKKVRALSEIAKERNQTLAEMALAWVLKDGIVNSEVIYADPQECYTLVTETQVDCLAAALGSTHGLYKGKARLGFTEMKAIAEQVKVPLVLHGGTGVSDEDMRLAVTEGINKVNVGTEMNVQWVDRCKSTFEKGKVNDSVRKFLIPANQAVTAVLMEKMALFK